MRRLTLVIAAALLVPAIAAAQSDTPPITGLSIGFRVEGYFGELYTEPPRQHFVFFQGEPIAFRVVVRNMGPADTALVVENWDPQRLFKVNAVKAPLSPHGAKRPILGRRFLDEENVTLPVSLSSPAKVWSGGQFDIARERETSLDVGDSVQWILSLPSANLAPGLYRIEVGVNGTQRGGRALFDYADIGFEVRPPNEEATPEILRREAHRRLAKDDYIGARQVAGELLKVHPNTVYGYLILSTIAEREGKSAEAAAHKQRAEQLSTRNQDELKRKYSTR